MTKPKTPTVRASDPHELIDAVPYLLGFHPTESLVLIGLGSEPGRARSKLRQVRVALRVDIPDWEARPGDFTELTDALRRAEADAVVCVWVTEGAEAHRGEQLHDLNAVVSADAHAAGLAIVDVLVASSTRWWSMSCDVSSCCPPGGSPRRIGTSLVAAEAALAGMVALPERDSVEAQLAGRPDHERQGLFAAITAAAQGDRHRTRVSRVTEFLAAAVAFVCEDCGPEADGCLDGCPNPPLLNDTAVVSLGIGLRDIEVRDELWLMIDDGALDAERLLQQLHTRLPAPYDAAALFLYGWSLWRAGVGTLAAMAAERALVSDERYSAAELLLSTVRGGLDPHRTPRLSESVRAALS